MHKYKHSDWGTFLTLLLLPLIAIGLIVFSSTSNYSYKPSPNRRPRPVRMTPQQSLLLNRSPSVSRDLGLTNFTERQLSSLVERMESASADPVDLTALALLDPTPDKPAAETAPAVAPLTTEELLPAPALTVSTMVSGLQAPDGLALDARNGNLYVSEEEANRVIMINPKGKRRVVLDGGEMLADDSGPRRVRHPPLQAPEGLAMDGEGNLYIVEDRAGGRVIKVQCDEAGRARKVEVVKLPGKWDPFAWEAIAVSSRGELLLGGSSAEGQMAEGATLFQGALLYRDTEGIWWALSLRPASGVSSVAFSPAGEFAIYTDEINGAISWMDLTTREVKEGASAYSARSPEGLAVMPDGRFIVAEERGRLILVDPRLERIRYLVSDLGSIESVLWDEYNNRLLVTSDGRGEVLEVALDAAWPAEQNAMASAPVMVDGSVHFVPEDIPEFLNPLMELGLANTNNRSARDTFAELTRRVPIMAADTPTTLIYSTEDVSDPIVQLVFVAVAPNGIMTDDLNQEFAVSAVILRTRAGQVYRSKLTRMAVLAGNAMVGKFDNLGTFDLPIPFAYQAQVSPRGHAVIHFAGLGQSPDVSIAMNPDKPTESFMVVSHMTGIIEQYRLESGPDGDLKNWVISLPPRRPDQWTILKEIAAPPTVRTDKPRPGS